MREVHCLARTGANENGGLQQNVAVIGAGAAGLATAKELLEHGHKVTVFEKEPHIGGVWKYTKNTEANPLGTKFGSGRVHSSMYASLRTNIPREVMSFLQFPFVPEAMGGRSTDPRRFPKHTEVQEYLYAYVDHYKLMPHIKFSTEVVVAAPQPRPGYSSSPTIPSNGDQPPPATNGASSSGPPTTISNGTQNTAASSQQGTLSSEGATNSVRHVSGYGPDTWMLTLRDSGDVVTPNHNQNGDRDSPARNEHTYNEQFDAVVVCNGHYSVPFSPEIPGADDSTIQLVHAHNYRVPEPFKDKRVIVVGNGPSGVDIAGDIADVAARVIISHRGWGEADLANMPPSGSIEKRGMISRALADNTVEFMAGQAVKADIILFCTGYHYEFPFLPGDSSQGHESRHNDSLAQQQSALQVGVQGRAVVPLYRQMFPPHHAPGLSFIGLPWSVVPFPQFELQARWVAMVLAGRAALPSPNAMLEDVAAENAAREAQGIDAHYTHKQGPSQWPYNDMLARETKSDKLGWWREVMHNSGGDLRRTEPAKYRDVDCFPEEAVAAAHEEFQQILQNIDSSKLQAKP